MQVDDNEKKIRYGNEKIEYSESARYLPGIPKGSVSSRRSVDAIIVTTVITMRNGGEKKVVQGYVSGFLFRRKATAETAGTAVTALCFSHCHKRSF